MFRKLSVPLLAAGATALVLLTTTALAGSGVGAVFNLGQANSVNAQSTLSGNPGASPLFRLNGTGTAATILANAGSGPAINGVSTSGTGQFGQSQTGTGLDGRHSATTGTNSGVFGQTNSTDPASAGVTGKNIGGGAGLQAIVNSNLIAPIKVNSSAKVTNLNADLLDGLDSTKLPYWSLGGNAGTSPGSNFIGTTDNQALVAKVNGSQALRIEPNTTLGAPQPDAPNIIGGSYVNGNTSGSGAYGMTIAGGGDAFDANVVTDNYGVVGGGFFNSAGDFDPDPGTAEQATVAGGAGNKASASSATVSGGDNNEATGQRSAVAGGTQNKAAGVDSFVAGGGANQALGTSSFAAGTRAIAGDTFSFVWGDDANSDTVSSGSQTFTVAAKGGTFIKSGPLTTAVGQFVDGATTPTVNANVELTANSSPTTITDIIGHAGQTITIIFGDANTTVSNGDIHLQGATNHAFGAFDTLTLVNLNGMMWYEVSRSDN
jgi:hypothetical protein